MTLRVLIGWADGDGPPLQEHDVESDALSIGRATSNDVVLHDPMMRMSRKHAQLERREGAWFVRDLGSRNGTFLNGDRLTKEEPKALKNDDRILIGSFEIRLELDGAEAAEKKAADEGDSAATMISSAGLPQPGKIADDLRKLYAQHISDPPDVRLAAIRDRLREVLETTPADTARTVYAQVKARFDPKEEMTRSTLIRRRDERIRRAEALYHAGFEGIHQLSERFAGHGEFKSSEDVERFARLIDQTLDQTMVWLSKCLAGRKEFEDQADAQVSMVFNRGVNPVKDAGTPREIGRYLLDWSSGTDPEESKRTLGEAFHDLTLHQLGLVAGVQECIKGLLERLHPEKLVQQVTGDARGVLGRVSLRGAVVKKAWEKYTETHREMFEEHSKLFNEVIFPSIRKGYLSSHAKDEAADLPTTDERGNR